MSIVEHRGGVPIVFRGSITTTGRDYFFRQFVKYIQLRTATVAVKLYFTEEDFTNDVNFVNVPVAATATPWGYEGPAEVDRVWLKGNGGTASVELIGYKRRG